MQDELAFAGVRNRGEKVPIPIELTTRLDAVGLSIQTLADQLFDNINNFEFRYTGFSDSANAAYQAHQGDCGTLMKMFVDIAENYGIPAYGRMLNKPHLVTPRRIHGRTVLGNTHDYTHWSFGSHVWVEVEGTKYDLLFMTKTPSEPILKTGDRKYKGVDYSTFQQGLCLIKATDRLSYAIEGAGKVFVSVDEAEAFIDKYIRKKNRIVFGY